MNSIKIGILTLPLNTNYGGVLQAYALQTYLLDLGFHAVLLDRRNNKTVNGFIKNLAKKIVHPNFERTKFEYESSFIDFIENQIPNKSPKFFSKKKLERFIKEEGFTHIITGSDQVWRCDYSNIIEDLFLNINCDIFKGSYAASFGFSTWRFPKYTERIKSYLIGFDAISVREDSGVEICKKEFGVNSEKHLDPTMLLDYDNYNVLIQEENEFVGSNMLLAYILDNSEKKKRYIKKTASIVSLTPYLFEGEDINVNNYRKLKGVSKKSLVKWLKAFKECKYVVTDSFHGTLFALFYNKPFIVLGNESRGLERFISILSTFGLSDRLVLETQSVNEGLIKKNIDYKRINKIFEEEKLKSKQYLLKFLNN